MKRKSNTRKINATIATAAIGQVLSLVTKEMVTQIFPIIKHSFWLNNTYKIADGMTKRSFLHITQNQYSKYEELKADDGIPNKKELLEAQVDHYKTYHNFSIMCWVNGVKDTCTFSDLFRIKLQHSYHNETEKLADKVLNLPQLILIKLVPKNIFETSPLFNDICFRLNETHPSYLRSATRLIKRIEQLPE